MVTFAEVKNIKMYSLFGGQPSEHAVGLWKFEHVVTGMSPRKLHLAILYNLREKSVAKIKN